MRIIPLATLSAALLFAAPATAQNTTQAGAAASTAAQATKATADEKKICKRLAVSGTRMADRVCLTKDEWKKVEEDK